MPPLEFFYSEPKIQPDVLTLTDPHSIANLPEGLDGTRFRWVDLHGGGLSGVLTEQNGGWAYKPNLSPVNEVALADGRRLARARLGVLERVPSKAVPGPVLHQPGRPPRMGRLPRRRRRSGIRGRIPDLFTVRAGLGRRTAHRRLVPGGAPGRRRAGRALCGGNPGFVLAHTGRSHAGLAVVLGRRRRRGLPGDYRPHDRCPASQRLPMIRPPPDRQNGRRAWLAGRPFGSGTVGRRRGMDLQGVLLCDFPRGGHPRFPVPFHVSRAPRRPVGQGKNAQHDSHP